MMISQDQHQRLQSALADNTPNLISNALKILSHRKKKIKTLLKLTAFPRILKIFSFNEFP